jgi:hypothetical protein
VAGQSLQNNSKKEKSKAMKYLKYKDVISITQRLHLISDEIDYLRFMFANKRIDYDYDHLNDDEYISPIGYIHQLQLTRIKIDELKDKVFTFIETPYRMFMERVNIYIGGMYRELKFWMMFTKRIRDNNVL